MSGLEIAICFQIAGFALTHYSLGIRVWRPKENRSAGPGDSIRQSLFRSIRLGYPSLGRMARRAIPGMIAKPKIYTNSRQENGRT